MSFIRPEASASLAKFREALTALAVLALGLWWVLAGRGLLFWLGWVVLIAGVALL